MQEEIIRDLRKNRPEHSDSERLRGLMTENTRLVQTVDITQQLIKALENYDPRSPAAVNAKNKAQLKALYGSIGHDIEWIR